MRVFVDAHEVLGDAEVIDHLSYAEERGYDDHTTERALEECSGALLQKMFKRRLKLEPLVQKEDLNLFAIRGH